VPEREGDERHAHELPRGLRDAARKRSPLAPGVDDAGGEQDDLLWCWWGQLALGLEVVVTCLGWGQRGPCVGGEGASSLRTMPGTTMPGTSTAVLASARFSADDGPGVS
jgi:hypothetical protein